jgi:8-oxo-dGTP diphosphatase
MAETVMSAGHLLLLRNDLILLLRRFNTGYEDGNYSLIAGHVEHDESVLQAMRREAREEANIDVRLEDLEFAHIMFRRKSDSSVKVDFFFKCVKWSGQIENLEPHKCDELKWFLLRELPGNTVPYIRVALEHIEGGRSFSEFGW